MKVRTRILILLAIIIITIIIVFNFGYIKTLFFINVSATSKNVESPSFSQDLAKIQSKIGNNNEFKIYDCTMDLQGNGNISDFDCTIYDNSNINNAYEFKYNYVKNIYQIQHLSSYKINAIKTNIKSGNLEKADAKQLFETLDILDYKNILKGHENNIINFMVGSDLKNYQISDDQIQTFQVNDNKITNVSTKDKSIVSGLIEVSLDDNESSKVLRCYLFQIKNIS